jgi:hypothetical protein
VITHYNDRGSAQTAWLDAARADETEGERTPAQTYHGERLVNVAGVALVPESMVAELLSEVA